MCPRCIRSCLVLHAKTAKNNGRAFYKCEACNHFAWCDDIYFSPIDLKFQVERFKKRFEEFEKKQIKIEKNKKNQFIVLV